MKLVDSSLSKIRVFLFSKDYLSTLLIVAGVGLAIALRVSFFSFISSDFSVYIDPWFVYLKEHGIFGLRDPFSNYAPAYLYLMYIASLVFSWLDNVSAVKLLAVICDLLCAWYVYKIVLLKYERGPVPLFAFFAILFAPTVVLNGSCWGQADIFFTTALIASLYFLLARREIAAFTALGLAVSFKLQGIFVLPLFIALALKRQVYWKNFIYLPYVYLLSILPAWILGRSLWDLFTIYFQQANTWPILTMNAPNMYTWFSNDYYDLFMPVGLILAASIVFLLILLVYKSPKKLSNPLIIQIACLSALVMPYFLPKMHDRYFFLADVLSIVLVFYYPRFWWAALITIFSSLSTYLVFLFGTTIFPPEYYSLLLLIVMIFLARDLIVSLFRDRFYPDHFML